MGVASLAHAFNACDNPATPYRYSVAVRDRFMELCLELYGLVETGEIIERRGPAAQDDVEFQRFMNTATASIG